MSARIGNAVRHGGGAIRRAAAACLLAGLALGVATPVGATPPPKLRVLILSGQNNHDWRTTTPALKKALESSGRFAVEVTERPEQGTAASLARYDAIVSNWTHFGVTDPPAWPEACRAAFADFVRRGKGHVTIHAGGSSFAGWDEYRQIAGISWGMGTTGHGARHRFIVQMTNPSHPITHGLRLFVTADELWHRTAVAPGFAPLATAYSDAKAGGSGADEPVLWAGGFGRGRTCGLVLGHDAEAIATAGFGQLLRRSVEWAATGKVAAAPERAGLTAKEWDFVLAGVRSYRPGDRRDPLWALEYAVSQSANSPEAPAIAARLMALSADAAATADGRQFACRQLGYVAGAAPAPALVRLLSDRDLSLEARFALERIPGAQASAAIRSALASAAGSTRVGLVGAIGARRDSSAIPSLTRLASSADPDTRSAAITALGDIGTAAAMAALVSLARSVPSTLKPGWFRAQVQCADRLASEGRAADSLAAYGRLTAPGVPRAVRAAAVTGQIEAAGPTRAAALLACLTSKDAVVRAAAVRAAEDGAWPLPAECFQRLASLAPDVRAGVLSIAARRRDSRALAAATSAASSADVRVCRAGISALGAVGGALSAPLIVRRLGAGDRSLAEAAQGALVRLRGPGVDDALASAVDRTQGRALRDLYRAIAARATQASVSRLISICRKRPGSRADLLPAVGALGQVEACGPLLGMLASASDDDRGAIQEALSAICSRAKTAGPVTPAFAVASGPTKAALCSVLGAVESAEALAALQGALNDSDANVAIAAVNALAAWGSAAPISALAQTAVAGADARARTLALRAVARLAPMASEGELDRVVGLLLRCYAVAATGEKKSLASALGGVPCLAALQTAEKWIDDPDVTAEAAASALKLADALCFRHPVEAGRLADRLESSPDADLRAKAVGVQLKLARGENLALGARAVSTDGLNPDGQGAGPAAAVDGDPATYWDEEDDKALYSARFELKARAAISVLRIVGYQQNQYAPRDFDLLADGKVIAEVRGAQYVNNVLTFLLPETRCSSVEIRITGAYGRSPAIREFEIYNRMPGGAK